MVLPGVSGGVMAVSMGLYEPMLSAVAHFFRDWKANLKFLAPIALGMGVGVLLMARVLSRLTASAESQVTILFVGLVLGGVPMLVQRALKGMGTALRQRKDPAQRKRAARRVAGRALLFLAGLAFVQVFHFLNNAVESAGLATTFAGWSAAIGGGIYAFGTVVPGISSSFLLLYLGLYQPLMEAIANLRVLDLLWAAAGVVVVAALLIKVVEWLFRRFPCACYAAVTGFVVGSLSLVFSWERFAAHWPLNTLLLVLGFGLSYLLSRGFGGESRDKKDDHNDENQRKPKPIPEKTQPSS